MKCPYLKSDDCGHPKKNPDEWCADYKNCISYKSLEACKHIKEEKKDGNQNS